MELEITLDTALNNGYDLNIPCVLPIVNMINISAKSIVALKNLVEATENNTWLKEAEANCLKEIIAYK